MIRFENLSKSFWLRGEQRVVIDHLDVTLPTGKSLAGILPPDTGRVVSDGSISWPVGFGGSLHPQMTGAQNVRFVGRVYGVDTDSLSAFVEDFSELGKQFHAPVHTYSSGMRARLGFGLSMGIKFDTYLIDETTAVGDARFNRKSRAVFLERVKDASAIMVSHQMNTVRSFCDSGIVLTDGRLEYYPDLEDAITRHLELVG
jgi:capsular polysaccharide transport system ATP-binding protein